MSGYVVVWLPIESQLHVKADSRQIMIFWCFDLYQSLFVSHISSGWKDSKALCINTVRLITASSKIQVNVSIDRLVHAKIYMLAFYGSLIIMLRFIMQSMQQSLSIFICGKQPYNQLCLSVCLSNSSTCTIRCSCSWLHICSILHDGTQCIFLWNILKLTWI